MINDVNSDRPEDRRHLLRLYLDDHWAGAGAGGALARRLHGHNRDTPWADSLAQLASDIADDDETLGTVRAAFGANGGRFKRALGRLAEMVSRLKPNARLTSYSPLSRVIEAEALIAGVAAKHRLWVALNETSDDDEAGADLAQLEQRAVEQLELLGRFHRQAARAAFGHERAPMPGIAAKTTPAPGEADAIS